MADLIQNMTIKYHWDLMQGSDEWFQTRLGLLTASEMKLVVTPTLKIAANKEVRSHMYELVAQRATEHVEDAYESWDMQRGKEEEVYAKQYYSQHHEPTKDCGFVTNDSHGFTIGFSPDGMIGDDGLIEIKSRNQKYQMQTILEDEVPKEYMIQIQTGLLVTERKWCDFISYSNGMPMFVKRVYPDQKYFDAIIEGAKQFEIKAAQLLTDYTAKAASMIQTERREYTDADDIKPSHDDGILLAG